MDYSPWKGVMPSGTPVQLTWAGTVTLRCQACTASQIAQRCGHCPGHPSTVRGILSSLLASVCASPRQSKY